MYHCRSTEKYFVEALLIGLLSMTYFSSIHWFDLADKHDLFLFCSPLGGNWQWIRAPYFYLLAIVWVSFYWTCLSSAIHWLISSSTVFTQSTKVTWVMMIMQVLLTCDWLTPSYRYIDWSGSFHHSFVGLSCFVSASAQRSCNPMLTSHSLCVQLSRSHRINGLNTRCSDFVDRGYLDINGYGRRRISLNNGKYFPIQRFGEGV